MDPQQPVTAYTARSKTEASIVQGWLQQEGIDARIFDGSDVAGIFDVIDSDPQVVVDHSDLAQARKVIENYRAELMQKPDLANVSDDEGQFDWPMCPICDELRQATCTDCQSSSVEYGFDGTSHVCLTCNKPTSITFLDQCKFCDHDFTIAQSTNADGGSPQGDETSSSRVLLLVAAFLFLLLLGVAWYFFNVD